MMKSLYTAVVMLVAAGLAQAQVVVVPGTSNIFGAGHVGGAATPGGGTAAPSISVLGMNQFTVSVTGSVNVQNGQGFIGPDMLAGGVSEWASVNGVAGFRIDRSPAGFLGVFTNGTAPVDPAPPKLDFIGNTSFASLAPGLNQIFFMGDGLTGTGSGAAQVFTVPTGAATLYLGVPDGGVGGGGILFPNFYFDNTGSYTATFSAVPEPSSMLLTGVAAAGFLHFWKKRSGKHCAS